MPLHDLNRLVEEIEASPEGPARNLAMAAVRTLLELHHEAFERLVVILQKEGHRELLERLQADPLLGALLQGYAHVPDDGQSGLVQLGGPSDEEKSQDG